ncbi:MAG: hypothetical protein IIY77_05905 [Lachnospiraceae bacterium]|nr:hypothetical protein [Lachnospiraceae bacterium]
MRQDLRKNNISFMIALIGIFVAAGVLAIAIYYNMKARAVGADAGNQAGVRAGKAVGSFDGYNKGQEEGGAAGKEAAKRREDPETILTEKLHAVGQLEVLASGVRIMDILGAGAGNTASPENGNDSSGNPLNEESANPENSASAGFTAKNAAVNLLKGIVVFTSDLSQADITLQGDVVRIALPLPRGEVTVDETRLKKTASLQERFFGGTPEAGLNAYREAMELTRDLSSENLQSPAYKALLEAAKEAAEKQISLLVEAVAGDGCQIEFIYKEDQHG